MSVTASTASSSSGQTFLTSLVTNTAVLVLEVVLFTILKNRVSRVYSPRSYLPPPDKRATELPHGWWRWLPALIKSKPEDVLHQNGLDAYLLLRFLRFLSLSFLFFSFLTWAVILPADSVGLTTGKGLEGPGNNQDGIQAEVTNGLEWFGFGNIPDNEGRRYAAHVIVIWIISLFLIFFCRRELLNSIHLRHQFLISPSHSKLPQARTVLITNLPEEMDDEKKVKEWASFIPGGVNRVWLYRDTRFLNDEFERRLKLCSKLESSTSKVIRSAVKAYRAKTLERQKIAKKEAKRAKKEAKARAKAEKRNGVKEKDLEEGPFAIELENVAIESPRPDSGGASYSAERAISPAETVIEGSFARQQDLAQQKTLSSPLSTATAVNENFTDPEERSQNKDEVPAVYTSNAYAPEEDKVPTSEELKAILDEFSPVEKRPKIRKDKLFGFVPWTGKKVDAIEYYKDEIGRLNVEIPKNRIGAESRPSLRAAFIQCELQAGAHILAQCLAYHEPFVMSDRYIEVNVKDVVWRNIDDGAFETRSRAVLSWILTAGLIFLWSFPVAFVGLLSNVSDLCVKVSWLEWICRAPAPIPGIIQGVVPPVILAVLFIILPMILQAFAWYENLTRYTLIQESVYVRYFIFLVVHGFLVVTFSSGLTAAIPQIIQNPTSAVEELASRLPDSAVFFLTYLIVQGLTGAGGALVQAFPLLLHYIRKFLFGRTPRQAYSVTFLMPNADLGVILPRYSLLCTIALAYTVIAPIINPLATISFGLFYFAWKFLFTWVFDQKEEQETGGHFFYLAIGNVFVGMYIGQICLASLFFLKVANNLYYLGFGIIMIVLVCITALSHFFLKRACDPLMEYLPISLATRRHREQFQKERDRKSLRPRGPNKPEEEFDMFSRNHIRSVVRHRRVRSSYYHAEGHHLEDHTLEDKIKDALSKPGEELKKITESIKTTLPLIGKDISRKSFSQDTDNKKPEEEEQKIEGTGYVPGPSESAPMAELERQAAEERTPKKSKGKTRSRSSTVSSSTSGPDHPQIDPAAPAELSPEEKENKEEEEEELDEHAFHHPSLYQDQPWVWVPRDLLGLSEFFVEEFRRAGVDSSNVGSSMNEKGVVEVRRNPPDEEWQGGHDQ